MKPILDRHNVRFIGVGVEPLGVEEFVAGNFFDGGKHQNCACLYLSVLLLNKVDRLLALTLLILLETILSVGTYAHVQKAFGY